MTREEMRDQIAEAVLVYFGHDRAGRNETSVRMANAIADAALEVVWPEVERLQGRFDFADQKVREWSAAAERAEARQQAVDDLIARTRQTPGQAYVPIEVLELAATGWTAEERT